MFVQSSDCDRDRLQQLLAGTLSESGTTKVVLHLETCPDCRNAMEHLAANQEMWGDARSALSDLAHDQDSFLSEDGDTLSMTAQAKSIPIDFLDPSDNPAMLGRLGEFEILEEIGCGGMGIVLKGYDQELNRYVAVKVLHPFCATSAAARRRFVREAQAAAAIVHQHVVAIHAVDAHHHPPFLVMPFIPGESLHQRLSRQGPLELIDGLRIAQQVAEGLAAAHAQGLVHRDIKPGNILLERNVERVLLTDFGLARAADDASLTRSGVIAGTPQFMSPEQARGDQIDHRTDLFSLGSVLYTIFAGHSPFRAESAMAVLRRVCDDTPRSLREINANVPDWLEAFVARLHAKQPAERFANATVVADLLERAIAHLQQPTVISLPTELAVRQTNRLRNRPTMIALAVAGTAAGVLIAALLFRMTMTPSHNDPIQSSNSRQVEFDGWDDRTDDEAHKINQDLNNWESEGNF